MPVSTPYDGETPLAFSVQGDEELVDYEATPRTRQYGAQRGFSARGVENWRMVLKIFRHEGAGLILYINGHHVTMCKRYSFKDRCFATLGGTSWTNWSSHH